MTQHDGFRVERDAERATATITLDVPEKLNRVTMEARDALARVFDELGEDDAVRCVLLAGAGDRAFTAGGDIAAFMRHTPERLSWLHRNVAAPERCPKPTIAKLHGFTFGVGLELALACDFRVAADDVQLALPEIGLGMIPGSGGTQRLVRLVGLARAKDMVLRGRRLGAEEALAWGLVSEVVPLAELDGAADALAAELVAQPALALRTAKRVLTLAEEAPESVGLHVEGLAYAMLRSSHDFAEGVDAFTSKRRPRYEDR
jgi:2-oxoglutaroyl-CoA hydrolase